LRRLKILFRNLRGGHIRHRTIPPSLCRSPAPKPADLHHVAAIRRYPLPPFAPGKPGLLRRKFMRRTLPVSRSTPFPGYFTLFILIHRGKSAESRFMFHGNNLSLLFRTNCKRHTTGALTPERQIFCVAPIPQV
jgi:hypothetical protein